MNQKSLLLSHLAVLILGTTAASASMNGQDDYPVLRGDVEIPVKCEGWFDPADEAKNIAAFDAFLRLQAEKAEERKATEQQADSLEIAASEALTKAKAGLATGKTDAVVAKDDGSIDWTPALQAKLDEAVDIASQITRDMHLANMYPEKADE